MKKILIVAATQLELDPVLSKVQEISNLSGIDLSAVVSGIGMVSTTYHLTRYLANQQPDLVLNVGIAGAFRQKVPLGSVFQVTRDCFAELGAEDKDGSFINLHDMNIERAVLNSDPKGFMRSTAHFGDFDSLPSAVGATVNTVHGFEPSIEKFRKRLECDIETMEGAAVLYTCLQFDVPVMQIRAISNHVSSRDRSAWNIQGALENLTSICTYILENNTMVIMEKAPE